MKFYKGTMIVFKFKYDSTSFTAYQETIKYLYPPTEYVLVCTLQPSVNTSFASYFPSKILAIETLHPLRIFYIINFRVCNQYKSRSDIDLPFLGQYSLVMPMGHCPEAITGQQKQIKKP